MMTFIRWGAFIPALSFQRFHSSTSILRVAQGTSFAFVHRSDSSSSCRATTVQ
jgi:hypothetical protein